MYIINNQFDIIIVGQGLVGASFALDIARQNPRLSIAILNNEQPLANNNHQWGNRVYAISPKNINYLTKLQVLPNLGKTNNIEQMVIYDSQMGAQLELDSNLIPSPYLAKMIDSNTLQYNINQQVSLQSNIHQITAKVIDIKHHPDRVDIFTLDNKYTASLLVGSDGARSSVKKLCSFNPKQSNYRSIAIVANFSTALPHLNRAFQFFTPQGILAYLPLPDSQISIVLSTSDESLLSLDKDKFTALIEKLANNVLGKLSLLTPVIGFPLSMSYLDKVYTDRVVLIGDAAHTIHPLAGMGVNLGFADAKCLAKSLAQINKVSLGDISVLAQYNAKRNLKVKQALFICDLLERIFNNNGIMITSMRKFGINALNKFTLVKKLLITHVVNE